MFAFAVFLGVALCAVLFIGTTQVNGEEERKLKLRRLEKIKESKSDFESSVQLSDPDAEGHITVSGELKQLVTLDNDWKVNITVYHKDNQDKQYSKLKELPLFGICEIMGSYYKNLFYEKLKEYSNAPHPDTCPLPPEVYHLKDYPVNSSKLKKFLSPGYYQVNGQVLKNEVIKLEYLVELQVE